MLSMKWLVLISYIMVQASFQKVRINTCALNTLGPYTAPTTYTDCTSQDPQSGTCCFVTYVDTVDSSLTANFCAYIPGSYVKSEAITDFISGVETGTVTVNCQAKYVTLSFFLMLILVIIS